MPFPSWPAVKPVSWWICGSPCDLGQMVPINISYHGAIMAPASHTSACRSHSTQHLSASCRLGLHSPTPMPSAQHPPVSPDFPRREVPLLFLRASRMPFTKFLQLASHFIEIQMCIIYFMPEILISHLWHLNTLFCFRLPCLRIFVVKKWKMTFKIGFLHYC